MFRAVFKIHLWAAFFPTLWRHTQDQVNKEQSQIGNTEEHLQ